MSPLSPFLAPERDNAFKLGRGKVSAGNAFYTLPGVVFSTVATNNPGNNLDIYGPIFVESPVLVDQLAFEVTTLIAAKNARCGLYAADIDWQPTGAPLADSGDISIATTGVKTYTPTNPVLLSRGRYLTSFANNDSTGPTASFRVFKGSLRNGWLDAAMGTTPYPGILTAVRTYAAFPTPGSAWTADNAVGTGSFYHVALRLVQP